MNTYTYFDPSGRVRSRYTGPSPENTDADLPNCRRVEGDFPPEIYYMIGDAPSERPRPAVIREGMTLSSVPAGATLYIDEVAYPCTDPTVELDFTLPGTYCLRVECFPYLDFIDEVTV